MTSISAVTSMLFLCVSMLLILIPSPQLAQVCDTSKENCIEKPSRECPCSKLERPPAEASEGITSREANTGDSGVDSRADESKPDTEEEQGKRGADQKDGRGANDPSLTVDDHHKQENYTPAANATSPYPRTNQMSCLQGGIFYMGSDEVFLESDSEGPARPVKLKPFCMDVHEVSVGEFELFVNATGHKTHAEIMGDSFVVDYFVSNETKTNIRHAFLDLPWWLALKNATWKTPEGIDSNTTFRKDHAVVHVSYKDAEAYCKWAGKRIPTEAEWEYACRGGLYDRLFPWGNLQQPQGEHRMNTWQGQFPTENTAEDGHASMAPVTEYLSQNKYGLKNMAGNVWEWVSDYWGTNVQDYPEDNPTGPPTGYHRVKKGGSFLCSIGYCYRYRCAARSSNSPISPVYNLGFRCAADSIPNYIAPYDVEAVLAEEEKRRKAGDVRRTPDDWVEKVARANQLASKGHA